MNRNPTTIKKWNLRIFDWIEWIFNTCALLSFSGMIIAVFIQVYSRFAMESAPNWTEELARVFFIFTVAFATGPAIRHGHFIKLDLVGKYFSSAHFRIYQRTISFLLFLFGACLLLSAVKFTGLGMTERSPAMGLNMAYVFFSLFVLSLSMVAFYLEKMINFKEEKELNA